MPDRPDDAEIDAYLRRIDRLPDGAVLGDWILVAQYDTVDLVDDDRTGYAFAVKGNSLPMHRLLGLLAVADEMIDSDDD